MAAPPHRAVPLAAPAGSDAEARPAYLVAPASAAVSDLRLEVCALPPGTSRQPSAAELRRARLSPAWFKERVLGAAGEIVDRLVDARSAQCRWTVHRPVRGWYLHLRSPSLPAGSAIPLRPSRHAASDLSATPLTFSLGTRIDRGALQACVPFLDAESEQAGRATWDVVDLGKPSSAHAESSTRNNSTPTKPALASARRTPSSVPGDRQHIRRRSAAGSGTHDPAASNGPRHSGLASAIATPRLGTAFEEEADAPHADRPYEPSTPRSVPRPQSAGEAAGARERSPRSCAFVITDGAGAHASGWTAADGAAPGRQGAGDARLSWARWAWGLLPAPVRPALSLDTSKTFSLRWVDPPSRTASSGPHDASTGAPTASDSIEILRFEDTSGWWLGAKTHGVLTLQEQAMRALGLERAFWVAVALGYLEFLEERDGYNAAADG